MVPALRQAFLVGLNEVGLSYRRNGLERCQIFRSSGQTQTPDPGGHRPAADQDDLLAAGPQIGQLPADILDLGSIQTAVGGRQGTRPDLDYPDLGRIDHRLASLKFHGVFRWGCHGDFWAQ
jgi:hypothetical protein